MKIKQLPRKALLAVALSAGFSAAHATNGYFAHGYGVKALGMGGASVAMTDNAFAGANNPAAAAFAGNRWDLGATVFSPRRSMERTGSETPFDGSVDSDKNYFLVPEFGYNVALSNKIGLNLTVYGNGGMNTEYPTGQFGCQGDPDPYFGNALCGTSKLGVDLMQLIIAPTIAYKFTDNSAIGVSPLLVYQRFKAYGLQGFAPFAPSLGQDNGYDSSTGLGVRVGYMAKLNDKVTFGANYSPKINMKKFDKYSQLFAGGGDFDIPENYTVGFAVQATPNVQVAFDYQRINYSGVPSVSNPSSFIINGLGAANGPGFGWQDINVYKLGIQWQADQTWTLRAGYNRGDNPIKSQDVTFNILAPGVMKDHYTFGATMALNKSDEISFFGMYAPEVKVTGPGLFAMLPGGPPAHSETIKMHQYSAGIQFSRKF